MFNTIGKPGIVLVCAILLLAFCYGGYAMVQTISAKHEQAEQINQRKAVVSRLELQQEAIFQQAQQQSLQIEQKQTREIQAKKLSGKSLKDH